MKIIFLKVFFGIVWGGCFRAEKCDERFFGCKWRWAAKNLIALGNGYPLGEMSPYHPGMMKALRDQAKAYSAKKKKQEASDAD